MLRRPFALFSRVASCLCFLLAAAGGCALLRWSLPFPEVPALSPKYRFFAEHRDEIEVLFIGSSRFYHHIIPQGFEEQVRTATGQKFRSFNAAYDAVWPPESYYFLRQLLKFRPFRLRWVFIEGMQIKPEMEDPEHPTQRQSYWHDWRHTQMALGALREPNPAFTPAAARRLALTHWTIWAENATNIGRGARLLQPRLEPVRTGTPKAPPWLGEGGYEAGSFKTMPEETRATFRTQVDALRQKLHPPAEPGPTLQRAMSEIIAEVRAAGAEPVFVVAPTLNAGENWGHLPAGASLISLVDPDRYPELYDPEAHYDAWHLNDAGAHLFTRRLAEQFALLLQKR